MTSTQLGRRNTGAVVCRPLRILLNIFIVSILIQAVLSWIAPGTSTLYHLLYRLNAAAPTRAQYRSAYLRAGPLPARIIVGINWPRC
jgi:hypothetical protein